MPVTLSARALRTRWALAQLRRLARARPEPACGRGAVEAMGLRFPSPLGLAAGFDRHGALLPVADALGLGAIETGSLLLPAPPALALPPPARSPGACRGLSLGKAPALAWAQAEDCFVRALRQLHEQADYICVNPGKGAPAPERFAALFGTLSRARSALPRPRRLALVAKLPAGWLERADRCEVARLFVAAGADGLLLSAEGRADTACERLAELSASLGKHVCLISVGGIHSAREARARLRAGASLVQLHRALACSPSRGLRLLDDFARSWR